MIYSQALNIFPTEIWEMIVYYIFKNDFLTLDSNFKKVCQSIGLPFQPLIPRMMKLYLPNLKALGIQALEKDLRAPNLKFRPLYNTFHLQTKYTLSNLCYQLPMDFYDQIMDEFLTKKPKCTWTEARLNMENMMELYSEVFGESSDLDIVSDEEEEDDSEEFKLWFTFTYAMLAARVIPERVISRIEMSVFRVILWRQQFQ